MSRMQSGRSPRRSTRVAHALRAHDRPRRRRGAEQQVHVGERVPGLVVVHRRRAVLRGERLRALEGAVRHDGRAHALLLQRRQRELGHLSGAEHHRAPAGERAEDLLGELHRRGADAQRAVPERRLAAHAAARRAARVWKSRLSTAPDAARLASHASRTWPWICASPTTMRVHARRDAEEVRGGLAVAPHVAVRARVARRAARTSIAHAAAPRLRARPRRDRARCGCRWRAAPPRARRRRRAGARARGSTSRARKASRSRTSSGAP